tara:strand:- start:178 stop:981 length:804 start_codon:yes stop_codon:yes gene_type:complete
MKYIFLKRHVYGWSSSLRVLPNLIVIGVVRSGTTSLYHYLGQHPSIIKSAYDELGYFDSNFDLGLNWYRSLFPTIFEKKKIEQKSGKFMTYDVTPFYIYNEKAPKRIQNILPNSKLILILRNPIDRAYSNYFLTAQDKKFEDIIIEEEKALETIDRNNEEEYYKFVHTSLLSRGFYAEQLKKWFKIFPRNQILIIKSEDFATKTNEIMNEVFSFLELDNFNIPDNSKKNKIDYKPMKDETRKYLIKYFRPYNEKLYSMLDRNFDWEK